MWLNLIHENEKSKLTLRSQGADESSPQVDFSMPHRMLHLLLRLSHTPTASGKRSDVMYFPDPSLESELFDDKSASVSMDAGDDEDEDGDDGAVRENMIISWLQQCAEEDEEDERWEEWGEDSDTEGEREKAQWQYTGTDAPHTSKPTAISTVSQSTRKKALPSQSYYASTVEDVDPYSDRSGSGVWWSEKAGLSYAAPLPVVTTGNVSRVGCMGSHAPPPLTDIFTSCSPGYSSTLLPPLPLSTPDGRYSGCAGSMGAEVVCCEEDVCRMVLHALSGTPSQMFAFIHHEHTTAAGQPQIHHAIDPLLDPYAFDYTSRRPFVLTYTAMQTRLIHLSRSTLTCMLTWFLDLMNKAQEVRRGLEYLEAVQMQGEDEEYTSTGGMMSDGNREKENSGSDVHEHVCVHSASASSLSVQSEVLKSLRESFSSFEAATAQLEMQLIQQLHTSTSIAETTSDTTSESYTSSSTGTRVTLLSIFTNLRPWERLLSTIMTGLTQAASSVDCISTDGPMEKMPLRLSLDPSLNKHGTIESRKNNRDCIHTCSVLSLLAQTQNDADNMFLLMTHPRTVNAWKGERTTITNFIPHFESYSCHSNQYGEDENYDYDKEEDGLCSSSDRNYTSRSKDIFFSRQSGHTVPIGYELYSSLIQEVCCTMQRVYLSELVAFAAGTESSGRNGNGGRKKSIGKSQYDWIRQHETGILCV